ncbi:MAG: hypothetical protein MI725_16565, partial [Pirellulales bacterium]|nr:hypothetical protein [Pirellulales bacterium]
EFLEIPEALPEDETQPLPNDSSAEAKPKTLLTNPADVPSKPEPTSEPKPEIELTTFDNERLIPLPNVD